MKDVQSGTRRCSSSRLAFSCSVIWATYSMRAGIISISKIMLVRKSSQLETQGFVAIFHLRELLANCGWLVKRNQHRKFTPSDWCTGALSSALAAAMSDAPLRVQELVIWTSGDFRRRPQDKRPLRAGHY